MIFVLIFCLLPPVSVTSRQGNNPFPCSLFRGPVVGYQTYELQNGFNLFSPTFKKVNNTALSIQDLTLIGSNGRGADTIQMLDVEGNVGTQYSWRTRSVDEPGWYDDDTDELAVLSIFEGQSFYICTTKDDMKIQCSGSVSLTPTEVTLYNGFNLVGNCAPRDISIQEIKLVGSNGRGADTIQMLDIEGNVGKQYSWRTRSVDVSGWYDDDDDSYAVRTIKAGEGLYFCMTKDGVTVEMPSAIPE